MNITVQNYTRIECDIYDANNQYLSDNTILAVKEAVETFRLAARFWEFGSGVYAAVEHIELKLKMFVPGSVMPPQFPHKPVEWPYNGQDDPYEGRWQRGWGQ